MSLAELLGTYGQNYLDGLLATWSMTAVSFVFVMVLAVLVTVARVSPVAPLRALGELYVQVFRNIPGVALLILIAYALPQLRVVLDWRTCVIVTVVLLGSAFGSENFMSGINTIGVGQIEAARSVGLTFTSPSCSPRRSAPRCPSRRRSSRASSPTSTRAPRVASSPS